MSVNFPIQSGPMAPYPAPNSPFISQPLKSEGEIAGELLDHPLIFKIKEGMTHLFLRGIQERYANFFSVDSLGQIEESEGCGVCHWNTKTQTWDFHSPAFGWRIRNPCLQEILSRALEESHGPIINVPISPGYVPTLTPEARIAAYQNCEAGTFHWEFSCHTGKQFWPMTGEPSCYVYLGRDEFLSVSQWTLIEFVSQITQRHPAYCQEGLEEFLPLYMEHAGYKLPMKKQGTLLGFTSLYALEPEYRDRVLTNIPDTDKVHWITLSGDEVKIDGHLLVRALEALLTWPNCKGLLLPETLRLKAPSWSIGRITELLELLSTQSEKLDMAVFATLETKVNAAIQDLIGT